MKLGVWIVTLWCIHHSLSCHPTSKAVQRHGPAFNERIFDLKVSIDVRPSFGAGPVLK